MLSFSKSFGIPCYDWWRMGAHYSDVIMGMMASQITSLTIVNSTVYSGADQRKHQSSASLAFVWGIHQWPVNSLHKWPVTWKMLPFDDVIMSALCGSDYIPALTDGSCRLSHQGTTLHAFDLYNALAPYLIPVTNIHCLGYVFIVFSMFHEHVCFCLVPRGLSFLHHCTKMA